MLKVVSRKQNSRFLPQWFHQEFPGKDFSETRNRLSGIGVHTVCREAHCPNISSCFSRREATFMILGDVCTRSCRFCAVKKALGLSLPVDTEEPEKIAEAVRALGLKYAVITSVTRDDLNDGGSSFFAKTIKLLNKNILVEALVPDFQARHESIKEVLDAKPAVFAHNIETIERLYRELRPEADYKRSLGLLNSAKKDAKETFIKSSLMLGFGETYQEVIQVMKDLKENGCDILTLGQYLAPSKEHYPVKDFVSPEEFDDYCLSGLSLGFKAVLSSPLARSSYKAQEIYREACKNV